MVSSLYYNNNNDEMSPPLPPCISPILQVDVSLSIITHLILDMKCRGKL